MIDTQYTAQLQKQYSLYLQSIVMGIPFAPVLLRGGKNKPSTTRELHALIQLFQQKEKQQGRPGWLIEWSDWESRKLGKQQWPVKITVPTEEDFLTLLDKAEEVTLFRRHLQQLLDWRQEIRPWLAEKPGIILEFAVYWPGICAVVDYLLDNNVSGRYIRSIPVPVHTKFIQRNEKIVHSLLRHLAPQLYPADGSDLAGALNLNKKPYLFPLRWLDKSLSEQYTAGMDILGAPVACLKSRAWKIKKVILVENETNLYMFPELPGTLAICSYGKALHLLREIDFLHQTDLYYWGDLDEKGFEMLNDIRGYYPHIKSLFMNAVTILHHWPELDINPMRYKSKSLDLLVADEKEGYELLLKENKWLEQEKLNQLYVKEVIFSEHW